MKSLNHSVLICILITIFSCHQDKQLYFKEVTNSLFSANHTLSYTTDVYYTKIKAAEWEMPQRVSPWKQQGDELGYKTSNLLSYMDSLVMRIFKKNRKDTLKAVVYTANKYRKELNLKMITHRQFLLDFCEQFTRKDSLKKLVTNTLTPEEQNIDITIPYLLVLSNQIRNLEYVFIKSVYAKIDYPKFRPNKLEAIVVPKSRYVQKGDIYEAQIQWVAIDTTFRNTVLIENAKGDYDTLTYSPNGKAHYTEYVDNYKKTVKRKGIIKIEDYYTGDDKIYTFQIGFQSIDLYKK